MSVEKENERAPIGKWKVEEDYLDGIHLPSWFPAHLTGNDNGTVELSFGTECISR